MNLVNPLFFLGAAAIGVPLLLHLVKRERAQKVEFPTLMFLRRISRKNIRYQKLRHLLLLMMRVLAFLFVVLAFMRPFRTLPQAAAAAPGRITRALVILIDNSMSMGYGDHWARAVKAAEDVVRGAQPGDKVAVLEFSDRIVSRFQLSSDFAGALSQIRRLELTDHPTRYAQALKAADQIALGAATGRRVIWLISDFQKTGWGGEEQDFRLSPGIELEHVDVGSDSFSNLAFGDVQVVEAEQSTGGGLNVKATVVNYGTQDRQNARVTLLLDNRPVSDQKLNIPKAGTQGVEFTLPGLTSGTHPLALEVDDPQMTRDNRFAMMVEARDRTPVVAVDNANSGRDGQPSSYFLARALNISSLSRYRLATTSPQAIEGTSAIPARIVIWNYGSVASAAVQKRLQDFVKSGGGLVVILDDPARAGEFNRTFGSWLPVKAAESGPRSSRPRPDEDYVLLTNVRMDHPIFQPFREPHSGTFATAKFFTHVKVDAGPKGEVLARFDNGDPALVSTTLDKGRVLVFTSSADDTQNDLPLKPVYAPLWQQMLHYLDNFQEGKRWVQVGDTIAPKELLVEAALKQGKGNIDLNQPIVVVDPLKQRVPASSGAAAVAVDRAGFYEVRTASLTATVAVNTIARESDLTHGNAEEMAAGWIPATNQAAPAVTDGEPLSPEQQDQRQRLWVFTLLAAAVLLISEALLGNKMAVKTDK